MKNPLAELLDGTAWTPEPRGKGLNATLFAILAAFLLIGVMTMFAFIPAYKCQCPADCCKGK